MTVSNAYTVARGGRTESSSEEQRLEISNPSSLLHKKNQFLMELANITVAILRQSDGTELFSQVCQRLKEISGAAHTFIALEHESGEYLNLKALASDQRTIQPSEKFYPGQGLSGTAWIENRTVHTADYTNFAGRKSVIPDVIEGCALPIRQNGKARGVLGALYDSSQDDMELQLQLFEKFTQVVSVVLENAERHQKRTSELETLESMLKINQAIYESNDHRDIMDSICNMVTHAFNTCRTRVIRYKEGKFTTLSRVDVLSDTNDEHLITDHEMLRETACTWVLEHSQPAHVRKDVDDNRESARVHARRREAGISSSYLMPLICCGSPWGLLTVHRGIDAPDFTGDEKKLLDLLASQLSLTIYRQDLMDKIEHQAHYDQLTGLPNRTTFENEIKQRVNHAEREGRRLSLLFIDLDGFKGINDTMGHDAGDEVLRQVATTLNSLTADGIVVGRLGGDEFGILTPVGYSAEQARNLGSNVLQRLKQNLALNTLPIPTEASVGIAYYPEDGTNTDSLLISADIAMYQAKRTGSGRLIEFDPDFALQHTRQLTLRKKLESALTNDEFALHFQPKVDAITGLVNGAEALIRWQDSEFRFVSPAEWIPIAEETGMMQAIGQWVLEETCDALKVLNKQQIDIKLSLNISTTQFDSNDFCETTLETIINKGISCKQLELEVTETALIEDIQSVMEKLEKLSSTGLSIAIDDFGVRYSSLAYLADLPIDVLKIDKEFIDRLGSTTKRSMVEPIIVMAHSLGLNTVAEGVETEEQLMRLRTLGCDTIQGYLYSKAVTLADLPATIRTINGTAPNRLEQNNALTG